MSSLAERTRAAVDDRPFLRCALAAGVVNYAAAARLLDVSGETDAVATALRRYADDLSYATGDAGARVTMESGLGRVDGRESGSGHGGDGDGLLAVNGTAYASGAGSLTCVLAVGDVDARALAAVLSQLDATDVDPDAAGVAGDALVVVVDRRDGPRALRVVEDALDGVPVVE